MMRALLSLLFASCTLLSLHVHAATFSFAAIGDVPYGQPEELASLVARINRLPVAFTIHVGDIKSGGSVCSDDAYQTVRELFNRFEQPLIYTPGDNEWTDCHRKSCGAYDPLERLEKVRSLFFTDENSLGKRRMQLPSQASEARFSRYVENRRWSQGKLTFATLHLVGSNNNLQPELPSSSEFAARDEANIAWLRSTFEIARARNDVAVVLAMQADTFMTEPGPASGFTHWLAALREEVARWNKPVLLIQGDTHVHRIDHPLKDLDGKTMAKLMRVVVPGERDPDPLLIDVDDHHPSQIFRARILRRMPDKGTEAILH
jgi:hypothetical protein